MIRTLVLSLLTLGSLSAAAVVAPQGNYQLDPDHTNVGFEVGHLGIGLVVGRFDRFQGTVAFNPGGDSKVVIDVEIASINTKVDQRDDHLRSADFFDAAQFPVMHFESTKVGYDSEGNPSTIEGNLTFHGATQAVTLAVTPLGTGSGPLGEIRAGFKATATIKRTQFGMKKLLAIAGDDVTILLNVEGIKQ